MKSKIFTTFFCCLIGLSMNAFGQKKVTASLDALLQSDFIKQFQEMKTSAVSSASAFKSQQNSGNYSPADQQRIEQAYTQTAEKFNFVLLNLKNDLLDRKKLKMITEYPDGYRKQLEYDMIKLTEFYAVNYQQVMADVVGEHVDGVAVLALINDLVFTSIGVFQLVKGIVGTIKYNKKMKQIFSEKELDKKLIEPHKFPEWTALGMPNDPYNSGGQINDQMPQQPSDNFSWSWQVQRNEQRFTDKPDKDRDGVADTEDLCPNEYGSGKMGCPDTDKDGVGDKFDKCPMESGLGSSDGCPNSNNANNNPDFNNPNFNNNTSSDLDGDGISDDSDACPDLFGPAENEGCPIDNSATSNDGSANQRSINKKQPAIKSQQTSKPKQIAIPIPPKKKKNNG